MFANLETTQGIAAQARQILSVLRDAIQSEEQFYTWLVSQQDADLTNVGFSPADVACLRGAFNDMHNLFTIAYGGDVPEGLSFPYNFTTQATQVISV